MSTLTAIMGRMATYSGREVTREEALHSTRREGPTDYRFDAALPVDTIPRPGA